MSAFLEERQRRKSEAGTIIQIKGGAGAGKSTALAHLAAVLPLADTLAFLDGESPEIAVCRKLRKETVILALGDEDMDEVDASFTLAPWTEDDLLEYLLAAHPRECGATDSPGWGRRSTAREPGVVAECAGGDGAGTDAAGGAGGTGTSAGANV